MHKYTFPDYQLSTFLIPHPWCNWCNWCKYPSLMRALETIKVVVLVAPLLDERCVKSKKECDVAVRDVTLFNYGLSGFRPYFFTTFLPSFLMIRPG
jgi:hypothetical protein